MMLRFKVSVSKASCRLFSISLTIGSGLTQKGSKEVRNLKKRKAGFRITLPLIRIVIGRRSVGVSDHGG